MFACDRRHADIVRYLLEGGADRALADSFGRTALVFALYRGRFEIAQCLVRQGFGARSDIQSPV